MRPMTNLQEKNPVKNNYVQLVIIENQWLNRPFGFTNILPCAP
jgi:hypothetical protein